MVTHSGVEITSYELTSSATSINKCKSDSPEDPAAFTVQLSGILFLAALCIFGNSIVIYVMVKDKSLNSPLNYFITSLAISDLMQGVIYAIYNIGHINVDSIRLTLGK